MKAILLIGGVVLFIAFIAWSIYEMKNVYDVDPNDESFLD